MSTSKCEYSGCPDGVITLAIVGDISSQPIHIILHQYLNIDKMPGAEGPRMLICDHKRYRMTYCRQHFPICQRVPQDFRRHFVINNQIWMASLRPKIDSSNGLIAVSLHQQI